MKATASFRKVAQTTSVSPPLYDGNVVFKIYCPLNGRIETVLF